MPQQASPSQPDPSEEQPDQMAAAEAVAADVSGRSLLELLHEPESEVAESMRKLLAEVTYRQATISSFGSFLS